MQIGSMVGVVASSVAAACCGASSAFAGSGCPTLIRVPKQAASIDAAIAQACPGVPLEIVVAPGTWTMSAVVPAGTVYDITIRGAGGGETVITDVAPGVPLCSATKGANLFEIRMKDLTVADVTGSESRMTFDHCLVRDCSGSFLSYGGATIGSRFERCDALGAYGVLYTGVDVVDCEFIDCARPIHFWGDNPCAARGCTFNGSIDHAVRCWASCCSGGNNIYTFEDCSFTGTAGNAVKLEYAPHPDAQTVRTNFVGCTFTDNVSPAGGFGGGAVRVGITDLPAPLNGDDTLTTFTNCTFTGNSAPSGGAIYMAKNHPVVLNGCVFTANMASADAGGAIAQQFEGWGQRLEAFDCTFIGNTAVGAAGAVSVTGWDGIMRLDGCTFRQNSAPVAGALMADRNTYVIEDCAFSDNEATGGNGGAAALFLARNESVLRRNTFIDNVATGGGGAIYAYFYVDFPVEDSVFRNNAPGDFYGNLNIGVDFTRCKFERGPASTVASIEGHGAALDMQITDCSIVGAGADPIEHVVFGSTPGITVGSTMFCGVGADPFNALVADSGGNCISEYCTDFDANGVPDACECATNPALPSCCLGDLFNDGAVNAADLAVVLTQWGEKGAGLEADLDGNGVVNGVDLAIVLSNWGICK